MELMGKILFAFLVFLVFGNSKTAATSLVTFIFGDSLTEVGNNNYLQSLAKANFPYYGIDYTGGKATGRFTNGKTIGDFVAEKLGIPPPPPYLSLSPNDDALMKGVNYASGGAGILNDTGLYFIERLSFDDQMQYFNKTKESIKLKIGEEATNRLCNEALYFIGIGSNDYVNNFLQPFLADSEQYTHDEFVGLLTSTLGKQLTILYGIGARKMMFHGLGPLGCIPSQRVKSKHGVCLNQVNLWVQEFNSKVLNLIHNLNKNLPSAQITFADTYNAVLDLIENPISYGFKVSNTSCCNVDTEVGGLCLPNSNVCKNRAEYVFWDAFHPSEAANELLAQRFFTSMFPDKALSPAPSPKRSIMYIV